MLRLLSTVGQGWGLLLLMVAMTGCVPPPRTLDLTSTHPDRAELLGRFKTTRPLYGYWQESGRMFLGTSITTPFYTDEKTGVFGPHPETPDQVFPVGSGVHVKGIERHSSYGFPDNIRLVGSISDRRGRVYPMEEIRTFVGMPDRLGPSWR